MADYTDHVKDIIGWLAETSRNMLSKPEERGWCILQIEDALTSSSLDTYFTNKEPNDEFEKEAKKDELTNIPVSQLQLESDNLHSLNKMMVYRHQPRLKNYRDDLENKDVRTSTSLSLSLAKLNFLKEIMKNRTDK